MADFLKLSLGSETFEMLAEKFKGDPADICTRNLPLCWCVKSGPLNRAQMGSKDPINVSGHFGFKLHAKSEKDKTTHTGRKVYEL